MNDWVWEGERFTDICRSETWGLRLEAEGLCVDEEYKWGDNIEFFGYYDIHIEVPQP